MTELNQLLDTPGLIVFIDTSKKPANELTIYMLICALPAQFSCQSDTIKFHDNILVVIAHSDDEVLIIGTQAKPVAR